MVRLNNLIKDKTQWFNNYYGLVVYGALAQNYWEDTEENNNLLDGLCPDRVLINDEWFQETLEATVEPTNTPHTAYAYYPPEYLQGHKWDATCSVFALFAITYKILTGELPYIGDIPEELLTSEEGLKYIEKKREEGILNVEYIPDVFQDFITKGLMLSRDERYKTIGDTADEFSELSEKMRIYYSKDEEASLDESCEITPSDFEKIIAQHNQGFMLNVQKAESGTLDDLVGLSEVKQYLRRIINIMQNPEKARKYKLSLINGLLFYGPPGCGKTALAQSFAAECKMNYAIVNAQDLASNLVHGTQMLVKQMFAEAEKHAPIILILDECECLVPNRNNPELIKVAEDTNSFLSELTTAAQRGILTIAISNMPQQMDSAILRSGRFDKRLYVPLPDEKTRTELFKKYLMDRPIKKNINYHKLSELTNTGYISSDIRAICDDAASLAFCNDAKITEELLEQVIRDGGPSVNKRDLRMYEESRKYMEPTSHNAKNVNQIGFR